MPGAHAHGCPETGQKALEALWALNLVGGLDEATAPRRSTMKIPMCGFGQPDSSVMHHTFRPPWLRHWRGEPREPDVQVRSQLACSAKRLPARDALPIVEGTLGPQRRCKRYSCAAFALVGSRGKGRQ